MKVEVQLFATLAAYLPAGAAGDSVTLEMPDATTVGEVVRVLHIPEGLDCLSVVNGHDAPSERHLVERRCAVAVPPARRRMNNPP